MRENHTKCIELLTNKDEHIQLFRDYLKSYNEETSEEYARLDSLITSKDAQVKESVTMLTSQVKTIEKQDSQIKLLEEALINIEVYSDEPWTKRKTLKTLAKLKEMRGEK